MGDLHDMAAHHPVVADHQRALSTLAIVMTKRNLNLGSSSRRPNLEEMRCISSLLSNDRERAVSMFLIILAIGFCTLLGFMIYAASLLVHLGRVS